MAIVIGKKVYTEEEIREYLIKNLKSFYLSKKKRKKSINKVEEKILKFIKKIENSKVKLVSKPEIFERVERIIQSRIEAKKLKKEKRKKRRKEEIDELKEELRGESIVRYDFIRVLILSILLVHKMLEEKELSLSEITKEVNEELGAEEWKYYKEKDIKRRYLDGMVREGLIKMVEKNGKIFYHLPKISSSYVQKIWKRYVLSKKRSDVKKEMKFVFYRLIIFPIKLYILKKQEECRIKKYSIGIKYSIEGVGNFQASYAPYMLILLNPSLCKQCNLCEVPRYYKVISDWEKMNEKETVEDMADFYIERIAQIVSKEMYQFYKENGCLTPYLIEIRNLLSLKERRKKSRKINLCLEIYLKAFYKFILEICRSKIEPKKVKVSVRFVRLDYSRSNFTSNNS